MHWQMIHPYLQVMGVTNWHLKRPLFNFTPKFSCRRFGLYCEQGKQRGVLLLDDSIDGAGFEGKVEPLIDAMLQAIKIRRRWIPQNSKLDFKNYLIMGEALAQYVLRSQAPLLELRSREVVADASTVIVATYHPIDLLHQPANKRNAWADLKKFAQLLGYQSG